MHIRKTLADVLNGKESFVLSNGKQSHTIKLDKEKPIAGEGGTCIVYNAWKQYEISKTFGDCE